MQMKVVRGRWFNAEDDASRRTCRSSSTRISRRRSTATPIRSGRSSKRTRTRLLRIVGVVEPYPQGRRDLGADEHDVPPRRARTRSHGRLGSHILVRVHPGTIRRVRRGAGRAAAAGRAGHVVHASGTWTGCATNALRARLAPLVAGGVVGLFLIAMVALGLTGVLWQNVTRRTREIGLRRAMGASGTNVHRQILARGGAARDDRADRRQHHRLAAPDPRRVLGRVAGRVHRRLPRRACDDLRPHGTLRAVSELARVATATGGCAAIRMRAQGGAGARGRRRPAPPPATAP